MPILYVDRVVMCEEIERGKKHWKEISKFLNASTLLEPIKFFFFVIFLSTNVFFLKLLFLLAICRQYLYLY